MLILLLVGAALALAYSNGANDNFKAAATLYGSRSLDYRSARRLATAAQISGSLMPVVLATGLLRTFSGKGLVASEVVGDPAFLASVAIAAAATVWLVTRVGLPVSTTHVTTGALFGIGIWNQQTDWSTVRGIVLAWIGTLPLAAGLALGLAWVLG